MKESKVGTNAVQHIAREAKSKPTRKDSGITSRKNGPVVNPHTAITAKTINEFIKLLVAPHKISPAITSSKLTGVEIIASKVF